MKNILIIFLILNYIFIQANSIDSLTHLLYESPDSIKVALYQELMAAYQDVDFSQSLLLGQEAIAMADSHKNEKWKAKIYIALGNVYHKKSNYDKSIEYYEKAKDLFFTTNDTTAILTICNNLGTTYTDKGEYAKSQRLLFAGLKIAEEKNAELDLARILNNIGLNYYFQQDYKTALQYYERALEIRNKIGDKQGVALAYNNIGIVYYFLNNLEKVVDYFHKALNIYEELGDIRGQSLPLYNIAEIYFEQKRYQEALNYYNKSLEIDRKVGDKASIAMSYYSIGNVYVALNNYDEAIKKQKEAIQIAQEIAANPILKEGYFHLSSTYEKMMNYKESLKYYKLYSALKDSIYNTEKSAQIAEIKSKYETEKKQEQIDLLQKEQAIKDLEITRNEDKIRNQSILLIASFLGIFVVFLFALLLYRQIHQKQKINALLAEKNKELDLQNRKLEQANIEIKRSAKQKEKFFANTSHELRNPLNVVIGFTNLLLQTGLTEKQAHYLNNIKKSGNNLLVVINDLLTHSKIEAGKLKLEYIDFDLIKEIESQIEYAKDIAFQKSISISTSIPENIPQYVNGDPVRFSQIMGNLLNNAIKFTDFKGKVKIQLRLINKNKGTTTIEFSIIDNGIGIANDKLKEIFESFTQANFDTTRKFGGTGLGLAIVKSLVELQGGTISVKSELNKGSEFTFNLAFNTCSNIKDTEPERNDHKLNLKPAMRILIVEDDPINITLACDTLKMFDNNIEIEAALNGKIAIENILLHDYDLVVMDIQMPVMDGYETTKHIRNNLPSPKNAVPILGMSAFAMKEEVDLCYKYGMNDYITKPFSPEELFLKLISITNTDIKSKEKDFYNNDGPDYKLKNYPKTLVQIYGNNKEKIDKIIKAYLTEIPRQLNQLSDFKENKGIKSYKQVAHKLKTSFNLIENNEAAAICKSIETEELTENDLTKKIEQLHSLWNRQKSGFESLI